MTTASQRAYYYAHFALLEGAHSISSAPVSERRLRGREGQLGGVVDFLYGRATAVERLQAVSPVRRFSTSGLDLGYILAISGAARTIP